MRIASTQFHSTMNTALQTASAKYQYVMQQMASSQRIQVPSDDPVNSVRVSRLTREEAALDQYLDNIGALRSRLQQNETTLDGMTQDLMQARDLMVWAADGTNTSDDVAAMANSLSALRDSLFYSTNSKDQEGRYLFSGTASATATVAYNAAAPAGSRYTFTGNTDEQQVVVGNGVKETANVTLGEMAEILNRMDSTVTALQAPGASVNDPATRALVTATMDGIDDTMDSVGSKIATLGGAQNILATLETNHANVSLSNKQSIIDLGQLDYGEAAVQLNGYKTAVEATQKAYAQVSQLSLFNVL